MPPSREDGKSDIGRNLIVFAATGAQGMLPTNPEFPADILTACLTTPIKMALRWFAVTHPLISGTITTEMLDRLPGTYIHLSSTYV